MSGVGQCRESIDHEIPYTVFDKVQLGLIVFIVSTAATFSGFASNIYFPALPVIADDLNVPIELINLTVTSYLIFQGLAPSFWGSICDAKGRRVTYMATFILFFGSCLGLSQTKNYATLIILRCLQSSGSASTIAIGSAVIGDITMNSNRGTYMGIFQAGLLVPVAIGPLVGGLISNHFGWRAVFWFLAIYSGGFLVFLIITFPETLRSIVANGSVVPSNIFYKYPLSLYLRWTKIQNHQSHLQTTKKHIDIAAPIKILLSKKAAPIIFYLAVYYSVWQMIMTAMSTLFEKAYNYSETKVGLIFIANGMGAILGTLITGKFLDFDYRRIRVRYEAYLDNSQSRTEADSFPLEKARLRLIPIFSSLQCIFVILFGWSLQYSNIVPIAVPIISIFIIGWTAVSTQSLIMTYLIDIFPDRKAAASASLNIARCLLAAGGTSAIMPLINAVETGLAFTICSFLQLVALAGPLWKLFRKNSI